LGSPRTGVIAHVYPETSISKQQTHQSGDVCWLLTSVFLLCRGHILSIKQYRPAVTVEHFIEVGISDSVDPPTDAPWDQSTASLSGKHSCEPTFYRSGSILV